MLERYGLKFEWDEKNNLDHLAKHGIEFSVAIEVFAAPRKELEDNRWSYGEDRFKVIGSLKNGEQVVVIYTLRGDVIRIISARRAWRDGL